MTAGTRTNVLVGESGPGNHPNLGQGPGANFPENPSQAISQLQSDIPQLAGSTRSATRSRRTRRLPLQFNALAVGLLLTNLGFLGGGFPALTGLTAIQPAAAPAPSLRRFPPSRPAGRRRPSRERCPSLCPCLCTPRLRPGSGGDADHAPAAARRHRRRRWRGGSCLPLPMGGPAMGCSSSMSTAASAGAKKKRRYRREPPWRPWRPRRRRQARRRGGAGRAKHARVRR